MSSGLGMGGKGPERAAVGEDSGSIYGDVTWSLRKEETLEKCMAITARKGTRKGCQGGEKKKKERGQGG